MYELSISQKYPANKYNMLGNANVIVQIPDIQTPVIQTLSLDTDPSHGEVYIHQKAKDAYKDKW